MESLPLHYSTWIIQTVALLVTCFLIPGLTVSGPIPAFVTVLSLGFINAHLWSTALFLNLPDSFTTHAVLVILANGALFWLVVKILPGIEVKGIIPALAAPLLFSISSVVIERYATQIDWAAVAQQGVKTIETVRGKLEPAAHPQREER